MVAKSKTKISELIWLISSFSLFLFPLGLIAAIPVPFSGVNLYFLDIFVGFLALIWVCRLFQLARLLKENRLFSYFGLFLLVCFLSFLLSPIRLLPWERLVSFLYLFRLEAYFFLFLSVSFLGKEKKDSFPRIKNRLIGAGVTLSILGWVQYFLYPDLRNLYYLGWDPHFKRIFSTILDPNYLGLLLVLSLIILFFQKIRPLFKLPLLFFLFATLMFTYSRSSFLALLSAGCFYSLSRRKVKLTLVIILFLAVSVFLLPRPGGEGVKLERVFSLEQRWVNWQQGWQMFTRYPVLGVGFNTLRFAKKEMGLSNPNWEISHSAAGFENSFLVVLTTTGLVGFFFYLLLLKQMFKESSLFGRVTLTAVLVHSFFLNSFFFSWVMFWLWTILALAKKKEVKDYS